jgi:single-stranded DNA-binding protein
MINAHVNKIILIGQVTGEDLTPRLDEHQSLFTTFEVITRFNKRSGNGQILTKTVRHPVVAWGDLARICVTSLTEGSLIYLEGHLYPVTGAQENPDRPSANSYYYQVVAEQVRLLSFDFNLQLQPVNPVTSKKQQIQDPEEEDDEEDDEDNTGSFLFSDKPLISERFR